MVKIRRNFPRGSHDPPKFSLGVSRTRNVSSGEEVRLVGEKGGTELVPEKGQVLHLTGVKIEPARRKGLFAGLQKFLKLK